MTVAKFAAVILERDEAFSSLIDQADSLREQGRAAVKQATGTGVPLDQVGAALDQVFAAIDDKVADAITAWKSGLSK